MRLLAHRRQEEEAAPPPPAHQPATTPIADISWRQEVTVAGRVRSVRIQPWGGVPTLECSLVDPTGGVAVVFLGRRQVAGIRPGSHLTVSGVVGAHDGRLAILNPVYELVPRD
ncbi:MAG: DNA-binding protein [Acidimicrobiales bacterium]|nr:MAG: DNA-binding protein [Acidimicrobiales bacterium]